MSIRPTQALPRPATDATVTSGDETGLDVRANPSTLQTQCLIAGNRWPARWMNWILGGFGDWLDYVREAIPSRLSSVPKWFLINIQSAMLVSDTATVANPGSSLVAGGEFVPTLIQTASTMIAMVDLSHQLPRDGYLQKLTVRLRGTAVSTAYDSALPEIRLYRIGVTRNKVLIDTTVDVSSGAAFQADHTLEIDLSGSGGINLEYPEGEGVGGINPLYLLISGAIAGEWPGTVWYYDIRASVTSRPWV